jgi:hypothetical protein
MQEENVKTNTELKYPCLFSRLCSMKHREEKEKGKNEKLCNHSYQSENYRNVFFKKPRHKMMVKQINHNQITAIKIWTNHPKNNCQTFSLAAD